ncbi:MAG: NAD(P)-dependent oxidoreductase [Devosiaceae bacterium]|nr:NAD(P)-dependent oxidoreductase [Devosiaceae bacterium]
MERIGIIGLGRMGSAIAQRMTAEGLAILGWTRSGRTVEGVKSVRDLETLVKDSDTLILSLFNDKAVADILDTLLALDLKGKQIIETSTVIPNLLKDRIEQIADKGATAVDAPISGGPELVLAGSCGVFIGGDETSAARARDSLTAISSRILHVGPLGSGLVMKVINNGMIQAYFAGLCDLMPLAKRAGLPLETALRILCGGPAGIPMVADRIAKVLGEDKEVGFAIKGAFKDNDVFQQVIESYGLSSPVLTNFGMMKSAAVEAGLLECDAAALINLAYDRGN